MILKLIEDKSTQSLAAFIAVRVTIILACWLIMVLSTIIDFWSGTATAKAMGEKLDSRGFRRTIAKDADYMRVLLFALLFDAMGICFVHMYILPFLTILCTIAILAIECKSVIENSRRKKTHAADIPDVIRKLVQAASADKVRSILEQVTTITEIKAESD